MWLKVGHRVCLTPAPSLFQESEPISHYLHAEIATELRQRLAKMGVDMLLKMVGTWLRLEERVVFLQKLFSWGNKTMWPKGEPVCFPCVLPFSPWTQRYSCAYWSQPTDAGYLAVTQDLGCQGTARLLNWRRGGSVLRAQCSLG